MRLLKNFVALNTSAYAKVPTCLHFPADLHHMTG